MLGLMLYPSYIVGLAVLMENMSSRIFIFRCYNLL
jgi:hypothetical protein